MLMTTPIITYLYYITARPVPDFMASALYSHNILNLIAKLNISAAEQSN
jgi:hypothetical protein